MRLPTFDYKDPESLEKALELLSQHKEEARILAGGTDLLVRMKKGLITPKVLISLKNIPGLSYIKKENDQIRIGAATCLADIIASDIVNQSASALSQACAAVGAVSMQHYRGTLGGNILQNNRCHHYNQSAFHRSGRQPCHKDGGKICYARDEADRCYSTCQSDGATALMALDAKLVLASSGGERSVDINAFYTSDGITPFAMEPQELLKEIQIPVCGWASAYQRLSYRSAIDYPIVCAGAALILSGSTIEKARIAVGAMGRSPLYLAQASSSLKGVQKDNIKAFGAAAKQAMDSASAFAVHNVGATTLEYRCEMVEKMVFRALEKAVR